MCTKCHPNGTTHGKVMTSYRFIKFLKIAAIWSWKSTPVVGFSDSTRLAVFKSLSKPNFDKIARSIHGSVITTSFPRYGGVPKFQKQVT